MKSPWMQTLAWIAAAITALMLALAQPEAQRVDGLGDAFEHDMPHGAAAPR